jgi:hypothetical protein
MPTCVGVFVGHTEESGAKSTIGPSKPIARQTLLGKVGRIPHIWAVGAAGAPETSGRTRHRSLGKRSPTERLLVERFRGHAQKMADTAGAVRNL